MNKIIYGAIGVAVLAVATSGAASATTVGYIATSCTITAENAYDTSSNCFTSQTLDYNYTLALPLFNSSLGTLTGVTLYFSTTDTVTELNITNNSASAVSASVQLASDPIGSITNTANGNDTFTDENLALFSSSGSAASVAKYILGDCYNTNVAVQGGSCGTISLSPSGDPGDEYDFAGDAGALYPSGYTVLNTNPAFTAAQNYSGTNHSVTPETTGTGIQGIYGATVSGTSISDYVGSGSFDLEGATSTSFNVALSNGGGSGNFSEAYAVESQFTAEVDYTYTPTSTPEPATFGLFGTALAGLIAFRKKFAR